MTILDDLRNLSSAEEFFDVLGVDYDPTVIRVARLHISIEPDSALPGDRRSSAARRATRQLRFTIRKTDPYAGFI